MFIPNAQLKKILIEASLITEDVWNNALKNAQRLDMPIEDILREWDIVKGHILYETVASAIGLPYVNLKLRHIDEAVLRLFDGHTVSTYKAIPFEKNSKGTSLKVAFLDPLQKNQVRKLEKLTHTTIEPYFTGITSYKTVSKYYQKDVASSIKRMIQRSSVAKKSISSEKLLNALIDYIYYSQPSDVHLEPQSTSGMAKFRVDGFLRDEFLLAKPLFKELSTVIKKIAGIRTDEHAKTADSSFSQVVFGETIIFRVSVLPTYYGEKIVLRVRNESTQKVSLHDLGFRLDDISLVKKEMKRPYGLVLVSGPTGSGKSSTLYTLLKSLNVEGVSIETIEDPVEYSIKHINQTQVRADHGFTFAAGLRAILRQDPNIIMVGEIRDEETASITIQSALTGHVVLSTLHSNSAVGALTRLRNMGVRSYLLAPTINQIISQQLIKQICPSCKESYKPDKLFLDSLNEDARLYRSLAKLKKRNLVALDSPTELKFYRGRGCDKCFGIGLTGRIGIFEILTFDEELKKLVQQEKSESIVQKCAEEKGMLTLFEDGLLKVLSGDTTIEELMRIS
ncbi:MAG: GspE/PulE family protein [Patescibacteria group bacterium]